MTRTFHKWDTGVLMRPQWPLQLKLARKIQDFLALPEGWHFGEGVALNEGVATFTDSLLTELNFKGFANTDVFPRPNGGIEFHIYGLSGHIELFIDSDYTFDYLKNDINDEVVEDGEDVSWEKAMPLILEFLESDTMLFEQHRCRGISPQKGGFPRMSSLPHLMAQVCQFSMSHVRLPIASPSVYTYRNIMQVSQASLLPS